MRRADREITNFSDILSIINECKVFRLAINAPEVPYIVPMNFGCAVENGEIVLYFHCAKEGRKLDLLRADARVGFEMDTEHALVEAEKACKYTFHYASVIGTGVVEFLEGKEKLLALSCIMRHQTGREFSFDAQAAENVVLGRVKVLSLSAKASRG